MNKPVIVVFDLGKVLVDFDYTIAAEKLETRSKRTARQIADFILTTPVLTRYETGLLSSQSFYLEVCEATGFCGNLEEFARSFGDIFSPIEPMIRFQQELRRRGVATFIFSNTNDIAVAHIRSRFPFFTGFDGYVLSYEWGSMKPDAKIYEVVEATTGRANSEILYIDDREENVAAGTARGWHTILHHCPEDTLSRARALGFSFTNGKVFSPNCLVH